jgi:hypothetical protein
MADRHVMTGNELRAALDEVLASLPPLHVLARWDDARLVVGPAGAFVLVTTAEAPAHLARSAERLEIMARSTRESLCAHLTWVPFVDTLVVTPTDPPRAPFIPCAALDLLESVLTEGPRVIDTPTLNVIRDAVRRSALNGWRVGFAPDAAKIDLCDPVQPSPTR